MVKKTKSHLKAEDHQHKNGKLSLNHSVSTTSITSIDLCTYGSDAQSDKDFQNRSLLITLLRSPSELCMSLKSGLVHVFLSTIQYSVIHWYCFKSWIWMYFRIYCGDPCFQREPVFTCVDLITAIKGFKTFTLIFICEYFCLQGHIKHSCIYRGKQFLGYWKAAFSASAC